MKYSSIDIETTGTDDCINQLIQLAVVLDDFSQMLPFEKLPRFKCYVAHPTYNLDAGLASLNDKFHTLNMIEKISKIQQTNHFKINGVAVDENGDIYVSPSNLGGMLFSFYEDNNQPKDKNGKFIINPAGKNVGSFDIPFIKKTIPDWDSYFVFSYRTLDPTILFLDPINDKELPNLSICKKRAGFSNVEVSHDAYEDCVDIVKLLRFHFKKELNEQRSFS